MKITIDYSINRLFYTIPNTEMSKIIEEAIDLLNFYLEILDRIYENQENHALEKKRLRFEDKRFYLNKTKNLPGLNIPEENNINSEEMTPGIGSERMNPKTVYLFIIIRGLYGSVTDKETVRNMLDSMTLNLI